MTTKQWFQLHTWAGMFVGVLLLFVCITGTLATVSHEIEYLCNQKFRALTPTEKVDFQAIDIALSEHYPNSHLQRIQIRPENYLAAEAHIVTNNILSIIYFDANTGQILGEGTWGKLSRFLRDIHRKLSMGDIGKFIVTSLSLLLLIILVSSLYVYKGWWRHFFKRPKKLLKNQRSSWSDWHKLMGVWSFWFITVISITGFWYFIDQNLQSAEIEYYPSPAKIQLQNEGKPLALGKVIKLAHAAFPQLQITYIRYPDKTNKAIEVRGKNNDFLVVDRANRVYLHPISGTVLMVQYATELNVLARTADTLDLFHFGMFAGLLSKLIWFIFGLSLSFMIASGIYMSWLKVKRKQPSVVKWQGISGIIAIVLCLSALVLTTVSVVIPATESTPFSPKLTSN